MGWDNIGRGEVVLGSWEEMSQIRCYVVDLGGYMRATMSCIRLKKCCHRWDEMNQGKVGFDGMVWYSTV